MINRRYADTAIPNDGSDYNPKLEKVLSFVNFIFLSIIVFCFHLRNYDLLFCEINMRIEKK